MTIRLSAVLAIALAAAAGPACDVQVNDKGLSLDIREGGRAADEWDKTYAVPRGGRFEVQGLNGNIEVVAATGATVDVHARREVRARGDEAAQQLLKQLQMAEEIAEDGVKLRVGAEPSGEPGSNVVDGQTGFRQSVRVDYRISVPPGLNVSVRTENGRISLENVQGRFAASSTNGQINGRGVSGGVEVNTVNGGVELRMTSVTDDVKITTVNGGVFLDLPKNMNGTLEATTVNGGVSVHEGVSLTTTEKDRRRVSGRLGNGTGPRIELRTTNGGVRLSAGESRRQD